MAHDAALSASHLKCVRDVSTVLIIGSAFCLKSYVSKYEKQADPKMSQNHITVRIIETPVPQSLREMRGFWGEGEEPSMLFNLLIYY